MRRVEARIMGGENFILNDLIYMITSDFSPMRIMKDCAW